MTTLVDISVGPVQGFVAQSRRTRDLWGSSYLLSFLAAHAMRGARLAGGHVVRPAMAGDPLLRFVDGERDGDAPRIGSVPNHFVVTVDNDNAVSSTAEAASVALRAAWATVCAAVWDVFVAPAAANGRNTRDIWDRQVDNFWEIQWTAGECLRRRKHWRCHHLPAEPGDKCTVMHDLQELSGYTRASGSVGRKQQDEFWRSVRSNVGLLDLRVAERLCAIALVKRLFPKVAASALGWQIDATSWPSSVYVGAVPWLSRVVGNASKQADAYAEAVQAFAPKGVLSTRGKSFARLQNAEGAFIQLDANYFHIGFVQDERLCPAKMQPADGDKEAKEKIQGDRSALVQKLRALYQLKQPIASPERSERLNPESLGSPPVFYALLLADGDQLGNIVSTIGSECVGTALKAFTGNVPSIVSMHDGVTVYAGGDDVLAMLPVDRALSCAEALAQNYSECFSKATQAAPTTLSSATLSATVVFAHMRLPHGHVLAEAHRLLSDVAKRRNGRDSVAAAVVKRGGLHCQWVSQWRRSGPDGHNVSAVKSVLDLADELLDRPGDPGLSSGLLFRLRNTISMLCGWPQWTPGSWGTLPFADELYAFLHAEVVRSLSGQSSSSEDEQDTHAAHLANLIQRLLLPARGEHAADTLASISSDHQGLEVGVDGLLLARFLSSGGRED